MENFIKEISSLRKENKNKWYYYSGVVAGKRIELKAYNLYLQIYRVDNVNYGRSCEVSSVKEFNEILKSAFN